MGSSTLLMLTSGEFNVESAEYSETVLPLPVGPVTRIMPWGLYMASSYALSCSGSSPSALRLRSAPLLSSTRITTFSPNWVGSVLTLKSIS